MDPALIDWRFKNVTAIDGPLLFARREHDVGFDSLVEIFGAGGRKTLGVVLDLTEEMVMIQILGDTHGFGVTDSVISYKEHAYRLGLSPLMLGRVLDGKGAPKDGMGRYPVKEYREINGAPINPAARAVPAQFLTTGISSIDVMNTLVKGQKLPIFSAAGLPSGELAALIVRSASGSGERKFAVVFAGMGIPYRDVDFYLDEFHKTGAIEHSVVFLNLADEPVIERLMAPRCALTTAEYLAFALGYDVLVVMTDMTHYCEALREVASAREEIPGRRGYPGYLYTDLARLYERAGRLRGNPGSITMIPILTMPDDDITHPIPDLTGYVTEGQIVLDRNLHRLGVFPPINPLPSLSRLMGKVAGKGTRADHRAVSDQLYLLYGRAVEVRKMAAIVGKDNLSEDERDIFDFGAVFEKRYLHQLDQSRTLEESLDLAWELFGDIRRELLTRLSDELIETHLKTARP